MLSPRRSSDAERVDLGKYRAARTAIDRAVSGLREGSRKQDNARPPGCVLTLGKFFAVWMCFALDHSLDDGFGVSPWVSKIPVPSLGLTWFLCRLLFALTTHPKILKSRQIVPQRFPREVDFVAFYLDDGTIAGSDWAVAFFCALLCDELADAGAAIVFPSAN